jgi:hypothetical protein
VGVGLAGFDAGEGVAEAVGQLLHRHALLLARLAQESEERQVFGSAGGLLPRSLALHAQYLTFAYFFYIGCPIIDPICGSSTLVH